MSCLYVSGIVLTPTAYKETKGVPSVDAIAIPPPFAVVSSTLLVVENPRMICRSLIYFSSTLIITSVPLTVRLP